MVSLIEELQVSIRDFVPGTRVVNSSAGSVAMVSDRLYGVLKNYATGQRISIAAAMDQLCDEIQKLA